MFRFAPIDLARDIELCIRFREDSYICSFGDAAQFHGEDNSGVDHYRKFLSDRLANDPESCQHVWLGERIVGQLEFGKVRLDPSIGYVNLFYLIPELRGQGHGAALDERAQAFFLARNLRRARLSVSVQNASAWRFYRKHGWVDQGPIHSASGVHWLEKRYLESSDDAQ